MSTIQRALARLLGCVVLCALVACNARNESQTGGHVYSDLAEAIQANSALFDRLPGDLKAQETVTAIIKAAAAQYSSDEQSASDALMNAYPNETLAVYLYDTRLQSLDAHERSTFAEQVHESAKGTALAARALDSQIAGLAISNPEGFLERCKAAMSSGIARDERVALFRHAEYCDENGLSAPFLKDCLELWAGHADTLSAMAVRDYFGGALRHHGYILEGELLSRSPWPSATASSLRAELFPENSVSQPGTTDDPRIQAYIEHPAELSGHKQHDSSENMSVLHLARTALALIDARSLEDGVAVARALEQRLKSLSGTDSPSPQAAADYFLACETIAERLGRVYRGSLPMAASTSGQGESLASALFMRAIELLPALQKEPEDFSAGRIYAEIEKIIDTLNRLNDQKSVESVYLAFIACFPAYEAMPSVMMQFAEYYSSVMKAPNKAEEVFAQVMKQFPDSSEARQASSKQLLLMYEAEKFEEAYAASQDVIAKFGDSEYSVPARFVGALCEASLGDQDSAELHLGELVQHYPAHSLSPRALQWIGASQLSRQDYVQALETFKDLVERYPESSQATEAKQYVSRLEKLSTTDQSVAK